MYSVGDHVVYPSHGAGTITTIEQREVRGRRREYLTIELAHDRMTAMIPVENVDLVGLRKVVTSAAVDEVMEAMCAAPRRMPEKWHARSRFIQERLGTGDILEVARVVGALASRQAERELPMGERRLFSRAQKILLSELIFARSLTAEEADDLLEGALAPA